MIQNRLFALIFRLVAFSAILIGVLQNFGVFVGRFQPGALMYYTILSNLLGLILFGVLIIKTFRDLRRDGARGFAGYYKRFEFVCVVDLLLTFAVYWLLLAPSPFEMVEGMSLWSYSNLAVHLIAPLAVFIDYILFTKSKQLKRGDIFRALLFPLGYLAFVSTSGALGYTYRISPADGLPQHFPYGFIDYDRIGAFALLYIGGVAVALIAVATLLYLADQKIKKPKLLG